MCDRAAWSSSKRRPSSTETRVKERLQALSAPRHGSRKAATETSSSESAAIFMHSSVTVNISGLATAMHSLTSMSPDWSACILCYAARRSDGAAERLGL